MYDDDEGKFGHLDLAHYFYPPHPPEISFLPTQPSHSPLPPKIQSPSPPPLPLNHPLASNLSILRFSPPLSPLPSPRPPSPRGRKMEVSQVQVPEFRSWIGGGGGGGGVPYMGRTWVEFAQYIMVKPPAVT